MDSHVSFSYPNYSNDWVCKLHWGWADARMEPPGRRSKPFFHLQVAGVCVGLRIEDRESRACVVRKITSSTAKVNVMAWQDHVHQLFMQLVIISQRKNYTET